MTTMPWLMQKCIKILMWKFLRWGGWVYFSGYVYSKLYTPLRTLGISRLKSRVLKLTYFRLKMMVKSGLEFILKLTKPLQRYLLSCQANSAILGRYFCTGQQQLWRGSVNFKINSRPLFTIIFKLKNVNFRTRDFSPLILRVLSGVYSDGSLDISETITFT